MSDSLDGMPDSPFAGDIESEPAVDGEDMATDGQGITERLFDGGVSGPTTDELQSEYGLSNPWAISLRGAIRAATGDGVPPVFEIVFGSSLGFLQFQAAGDENAENGAASGDVTTRFDAEPDSAGGVTDE